jgi:O-antigen/teichoic acid export membrane protein
MNDKLDQGSYFSASTRGDGDCAPDGSAGASTIGVNGEIASKPFCAGRTIPMQTARSRWAWIPTGAGIRARIAVSRLTQPLATASIGALTVYTAGAGLSCLSQLFIARTIGADSFGIYSYVLAWVTLLAYLSTLGFHVSLLRFMPAYRATQRWPLVRGVIQFSQRAAAGTGICIILIGSCIILALDRFMRPELAATFLIGIVTVPIISQHLISASIVRAFGGIMKAIAPERVVRDGVMLALVAVASWSNLFRPDARVAMAAALVGALATFALLRIFLRQLHPPELDHERPAYAAKEWCQPILPLMIIAIADNLMNRSGIIVLGLSGDTRQAGIFAVALSLSMLTALPRMAVAAAFAPTISDLYARDDLAGLQALAGRAAYLSLLGTVGVAIPLLLINSHLLALFGQSFVAGAPIVIILVLGQVFAAACGPQQHLITMTGHERIGAAFLTACAGANLAACLLTIDSLGMTGAALAMSATLVAWNVAMGIFIYRRLHLMPGLISAFRSIR